MEAYQVIFDIQFKLDSRQIEIKCLEWKYVNNCLTLVCPATGHRRYGQTK